MFAPPPEGTFDLEDANLPLKIPQKDASSEHIPLLMQEAAPMGSDNSKKGKVTIMVIWICSVWCFAINLSWLISGILLQIKSFLVFVYEKLKLKQLLQPPIIASVSFTHFVGFSFLNSSLVWRGKLVVALPSHCQISNFRFGNAMRVRNTAHSQYNNLNTYKL